MAARNALGGRLVFGSLNPLPALRWAWIFSRSPPIADILKPVMGSGYVSQTERHPKKSIIRMIEALQESVVRKGVFWLEFDHSDQRTGARVYAKMLATKDDFQFHRMIFQRPSQPAMEMPMIRERAGAISDGRRNGEVPESWGGELSRRGGHKAC